MRSTKYTPKSFFEPSRKEQRLRYMTQIVEAHVQDSNNFSAWTGARLLTSPLALPGLGETSLRLPPACSARLAQAVNVPEDVRRKKLLALLERRAAQFFHLLVLALRP